MLNNIFAKFRPELLIVFETLVGLLAGVFAAGITLLPALNGMAIAIITLDISVMVFLGVLFFSTDPNYVFKIIGIYSHGIILTFLGDGIKDCVTGNFDKGIVSVVIYSIIFLASLILIYKRRKIEERNSVSTQTP